MCKKLFYLFLGIFIISCENGAKKEMSDEVTSEKNSDIGRLNYAVVWEWASEDEDFVADNMEAIAKEMTKLWKEDNAENFYYNAQSKTDKFSYFPNIVFTLKALDIEKAKSMLDELIIVEKGIANYTLFPVGTLWLKRNEDAIKKRGLTKSYVSVWKSENNVYSDELVQDQNDKMLELWNSGKVENAYFDIEGTQKNNTITDFVFFINANTEEEAKEICDSLPFSKENIASYTMHEVGVFFLGQTK